MRKCTYIILLIFALSAFSDPAPLPLSNINLPNSDVTNLYDPGHRAKFKLFDGTQYTNKPNLTKFGIFPIKVVYASEIWSKKQNYEKLPERLRIESFAKKLTADIDFVVIDIEHWPITGYNDQLITESLSKYQQVISLFKLYAPQIKFGFYGRPPVPDYWRAIDASPQKRRTDWVAENDRITPLAETVDALYPSLYTFYADQIGWAKYAIAQIYEARRLSGGKPVFAFIWPQYHDSNRLLRCQFLPSDYWKLQLETVRKYADGAVIWGGWDVCNKKGKALPWIESAEWWQVTKEFSLRINK